jgi:G3E family GTPase
LIEPSGVGKLSDVLKAIENVAGDLDVQINSAVAVVDASKCKMYIKNFGEFFVNQIQYAGTIILSRTDKVSDEKIAECVELIREHNTQATIITTPLEQLDGTTVLNTIEGADKIDDLLQEMMEKAKSEPEHHHHHDHDEECGCHHHHHDDDEDDEDDHEHHHHHHDDEDDEDEHEHHHHHHDEDDEDEHEHHHHHHDDEDDEDEHEHHHHHHHDEEDEHEHHHDHHHHHADEVFTSWGVETPNKYSSDEIEKILTALDSGEYGAILRAKGMVPAEDGTWIYYDYVPEEHDVRSGKPEVTGKICVIGSELKEDNLKALFGV